MFDSNQEELKTVWYLSTVGRASSKIYKKVSKANALKVSIPKTCKLVVDSSTNLRLSSNLLYGISLLYKLQVNYFLNDLLGIDTDIKYLKEGGRVAGRGLIPEEVNDKVGLERGLKGGTSVVATATSKRALSKILLGDDPCFIIEDFCREFEEDPYSEIEFGRRVQEGFNLPITDKSLLRDDPELEFPEYELTVDNVLPGSQLELNLRIGSHGDTTMNLDFDFDLDLSGRNTPSENHSEFILPVSDPLDIPLESQQGQLRPPSSEFQTSVSESNTSNSIRLNKGKRKFKLIEDDDLTLPDNAYNVFEDNYELIVEIEKYRKLSKPNRFSNQTNDILEPVNKFLINKEIFSMTHPMVETVPMIPVTPTTPTTPEVGRRLVNDSKYSSPQVEIDGFDQYEYDHQEDQNTDSSRVSSQPFELSFPTLEEFRSSSRVSTNRSIGNEPDNELQIIELHKFHNYLLNIENGCSDQNQEKTLNFSNICPIKCKRNLVAKSFLKVLELSTNDMIKVNTIGNDNNEFELTKHDQIEVIIKGEN